MLLGIWFFLDIIRCVGAEDETQRMSNLLASPLGREHSFFGLLRGKVTQNVSTRGLMEKWESWSLSKIESLQGSCVVNTSICP